MFAEQNNPTSSNNNTSERHPHFSTLLTTQIRATTCRTSSMELRRSTATTSSTVPLSPLSIRTLQERLRLCSSRGKRIFQGKTQLHNCQEAARIPIAEAATPGHQLLIGDATEHAANLPTVTVGHGAAQERNDHGHPRQSHQSRVH